MIGGKKTCLSASISGQKKIMKTIISSIKRENTLEEKKLQERLKLAEKEIKRLQIKFLEIDPDLEKMILFGSLAQNSVSTDQFDVDIAVKFRKYLQLVNEVLNSAFKIDLIDLESANPIILGAINKHGKIIYEKK